MGLNERKIARAHTTIDQRSDDQRLLLRTAWCGEARRAAVLPHGAAACWSNDNPNDVFIEDLNRHDPYQRPTAAARNTAYIAEQRRLLRKLLRKARREKRLPHGEALCAEFADPKKQASSSKPEEVISLLDDELDDDEQSKWHKKRTSQEELDEL